jgi:hypothetical protein
LQVQTCAIGHSLSAVWLMQSDRETLVSKLLISPEQAGAFCNSETSRMAGSSGFNVSRFYYRN